MSSDDAADLSRERDEFFRRTRRMVVLLYVGLVVAAVASAVVGFLSDAVGAAVGVAIGVVVMLALFAAGLRVAIPARAVRPLIVSGVVVSVIGAALFGEALVARSGSSLFLGFFAGSMIGSVLGTAASRHLLATNDELWRRQKQLGYDPERPFDSLRSRRSD